jgi:hypothetical protein
MRDERYLVEAFFNHYRQLGVERFYVFDDQSQDGTREWLCDQEDAVVLTSSLRYGDATQVCFPDGTERASKFGVAMKSAMQYVFSRHRHCLYADADEFIVFPAHVNSFDELVKECEADNVSAVPSAVAEFFPTNWSPPYPNSPELQPRRSMASLLEVCPYFEAERTATIRRGRLRRCGLSKSERLFQLHGLFVERQNQFLPWKRWRKRVRTTPHTKVNFLRPDDRVFLVGSHSLSRTLTQGRMLFLAHFVFTPIFSEKIDKARAWRSYNRMSEKYDYYQKLAERLSEYGQSLLSDRSVRFQGAEQLEELGLLRWSRRC